MFWPVYDGLGLQSVHGIMQAFYAMSHTKINNTDKIVDYLAAASIDIFCIGRGCASVLKTHLSSGIRSSSEKIRYKYFNVSAKKKLCWTSSFGEFCW